MPYSSGHRYPFKMPVVLLIACVWSISKCISEITASRASGCAGFQNNTVYTLRGVLAAQASGPARWGSWVIRNPFHFPYRTKTVHWKYHCLMDLLQIRHSTQLEEPGTFIEGTCVQSCMTSATYDSHSVKYFGNWTPVVYIAYTPCKYMTSNRTSQDVVDQQSHLTTGCIGEEN